MDHSSFYAELPPGTYVGEYVIVAKIGHGAAGNVYSAQHAESGVDAAVKVLRREHSQDEAMVARFEAEARAVDQIGHGNIVDIFAFGILEDGRHYLVMELLVGAPLDRYMDQQGPLGVAVTLAILRHVVAALDAAHAAGVAHRDLKPENIFLTFDPHMSVRGTAGMSAKLLDFGIAKLFRDDGMPSITQTGESLGTPAYMSPEQWRGRGVDHRTDLYSLGIVAYEMLAGQRPFHDGSVGEVLLQACTVEPPPLSKLAPSLPAAFDAPLLAMLAKDPDGRPSSAGEALRRLEQAAQAG